MGDTRSRGDSCGAGVRTPDAGGGSDRLSNSNLEGTSRFLKKKITFLLPFYFLMVFLIVKRSHILNQSCWIATYLLQNHILNVRSLAGKHEGDERVEDGERETQISKCLNH